MLVIKEPVIEAPMPAVEGRQVFAGARHMEVYFAHMAARHARFLPATDAQMLDFACGAALSAHRLAATCSRLVLCDPCAGVRADLSVRYGSHPGIEIIAPEDLAGLPERAFSLITANSAVQYLAPGAFMSLLETWRRLLKKGGSLILSDMIPSDTRAGGDASALLGLAFREGFFLDAVMGLGRSSPDGRPGRAMGLTYYDERELLALLESVRLPATRLHPNVGLNPRRLSFRAYRLR